MGPPRHPALPPEYVSLAGCEAKLRRAKHHQDDLRRVVATTLDEHGYEVRFHTDTDGGKRDYVFTIHNLPEADPDWSLLIGDCIHNLRSTLDHLAFQLSILGKGSPLTEEEARLPFFPVCNDPTKWNGWRSKLRLMRKGEITRIEELQPFNATDRSIYGWYPPIAAFPDRLLRLEMLDNIDKHRELRPVWHSIKLFSAPDPPLKLKGSTVSFESLVDGAEIGRWQCADGPIPELPPDMDVQRYFPLQISVGDVAPFSGADELLTGLYATVATVLDVFRPCIETGDPALPAHLTRSLWEQHMEAMGRDRPVGYSLIG